MWSNLCLSILYYAILHISFVKGNYSTTENDFSTYDAINEGKRSIATKMRYLSTAPEIAGTEYPLERFKNIPKTGKKREQHSGSQPSNENIVYQSVISALANPTTLYNEYPTQTVTYSDESTRNHVEKTVLFSTVMDMKSKNHSVKPKVTNVASKSDPEYIEKLTEMIPNFNKLAIKLNISMMRNHSNDIHDLNRKFLMENIGVNGQNNTKSSSKKLNKLAILLSKISWDILERHDDIKNMHKQLIHTYFDFLKKKSEINQNITDFIKKQSELDNQKKHILQLENMLVEKQNKFEDRQKEFKIKEKEFENVQKKFLMRQHDFAKNQVYLTNKSEKIMKQQNEISHSQADIGASQATLAKLFKNTHKIPIQNSKLHAFDKLKKDSETNYYDNMMKELHEDYTDKTSESLFNSPKNIGRQRDNDKKLENNKKHIEENIKIKSPKNKSLSQKTIHYLETYDIDDLVYQRYFKNTSFDRIFRKAPLKKPRSYRDITYITPSIESLLENIILPDGDQNATEKKLFHSDLLEYMDMVTTEKADTTNVLDNIYDYLSKHVGKPRTKRNTKMYKDHQKHHKKSIRNLEKNVRKNTFYRSIPSELEINTNLEKITNGSNSSLDLNSTMNQMITNAKRFCNEIDQNSNEVTFKYCVEKALRRLQNSETKNNKTKQTNVENRQFKNVTTGMKDLHNSTDHRIIVNLKDSSFHANKIDMTDYNDNEVLDDGLKMNTEGTIYWDGSVYNENDEEEGGISDKLPGDTSDSNERRKYDAFFFRSEKKNRRKSSNKQAWRRLKRRH